MAFNSDLESLSDEESFCSSDGEEDDKEDKIIHCTIILSSKVDSNI